MSHRLPVAHPPHHTRTRDATQTVEPQARLSDCHAFITLSYLRLNSAVGLLTLAQTSGDEKLEEDEGMQTPELISREDSTGLPICAPQLGSRARPVLSWLSNLSEGWKDRWVVGGRLMTSDPLYMLYTCLSSVLSAMRGHTRRHACVCMCA